MKDLIENSKERSKFEKPEYFINRELSWLDFNARVLDEGLSESVPILEQVKFLAIFSSNLDEFFMIRVAGLIRMNQEGFETCESPDESDIVGTLNQIQQKTKHLLSMQYQHLTQAILPKLAANLVRLVPWTELSQDEKVSLSGYFSENVLPVLTPLAVDESHPFPFLNNLSIYLVLTFKEMDSFGNHRIGFVRLPGFLPRLVRIEKREGFQFLLLEELIIHHLDRLFLGAHIDTVHPIRVTRSLDYSLLENNVVDILKTMEKEILDTRNQQAVRLEIDESLPAEVLDLFKAKLKINPMFIYRVNGPLALDQFTTLYGLPLPDLRDHHFNPRLPSRMSSDESIFSIISKGDMLVHHPYESFYAVTEFIQAAAEDPAVLAIKQTLYRSAGDSPVIESLIRAAEEGKQVTAVVELKARFDEKNNIVWAKRMESAGVHVVYGFLGLKTHAKMALIVRREGNRMARYVHLSTGNYNSKTAKLYTDLSFFTKDQKIGDDVSTIFNVLTGFNHISEYRKNPSIFPKMNKLIFAPIELRERILQLISSEIATHQLRGGGLIFAKMNAIADREIIAKLYEASAAGVQVNLIVRGISCLKVGIPGVSDNIRLVSIIDRFLEHSRIYYFGASDRVFVGSADLMTRNMDRRIEVWFPVEDPMLKGRLVKEILGLSWADNVKARAMSADGSYIRRQPPENGEAIRSQSSFIKEARSGGIKSLPYETALRYNRTRKEKKRPVVIAEKAVKRKSKE
jgi:polyphosphate kinase